MTYVVEAARSFLGYGGGVLEGFIAAALFSALTFGLTALAFRRRVHGLTLARGEAARMERRSPGPDGFEAPVVGMGTSRTLDVRGRAAETTAAGSSKRRSTPGPTSDSSPMYGEAERVLGLALDGWRQEAIVATKVWTADDDQAERQIETSRLAHGRVELYQIHNLVAWPARLERLERLRDDGLVDVVGATTTTRPPSTS